MEFKHLRIDNWIMGCNNQPLQVTDETFMNLMQMGNECLSEIPITHDTLISLGFTQNVSHARYYHYKKLRYNLKYCRLEINIGSKPASEDSYWFGKHLDCKYISQLQNIFYFLTGRELIIKFKSNILA